MPTVEFFGGPWDGERRDVPDEELRDDWLVPREGAVQDTTGKYYSRYARYVRDWRKDGEVLRFTFDEEW